MLSPENLCRYIWNIIGEYLELKLWQCNQTLVSEQARHKTLSDRQEDALNT
jgi:hypothetical protein